VTDWLWPTGANQTRSANWCFRPQPVSRHDLTNILKAATGHSTLALSGVAAGRRCSAKGVDEQGRPAGKRIWRKLRACVRSFALLNDRIAQSDLASCLNKPVRYKWNE
jgi:hypothetical protein